MSGSFDAPSLSRMLGYTVAGVPDAMPDLDEAGLRTWVAGGGFRDVPAREAGVWASTVDGAMVCDDLDGPDIRRLVADAHADPIPQLHAALVDLASAVEAVKVDGGHAARNTVKAAAHRVEELEGPALARYQAVRQVHEASRAVLVDQAERKARQSHPTPPVTVERIPVTFTR